MNMIQYDLTPILKQKLYEHLDITYLDITNDSAAHQGHRGDNGSGNSHFTIIITANDFKNISLVKRHRIIYDTLQEFMNNPIHALAIHAK